MEFAFKKEKRYISEIYTKFVILGLGTEKYKPRRFENELEFVGEGVLNGGTYNQALENSPVQLQGVGYEKFKIRK